MSGSMASFIYTKRLIDEGITAESAHDARVAVLQSKTLLSVSPDMSPAERSECIKEAAIHNGPILRLARLWKLVEVAIANGYDVMPGCRFEEGIQSGSGPLFNAIRMRWLNELHPDWQVPTMILSATANPDLLRSAWPQLELVADVNPVMLNATVRQILFSAASHKLENPNHLQRLKRYIEVRALEFRDQGKEIEGRRVDVLVIAQMGTEDELNSLSLPDNVDTAHFNAVEGIDKWGGVPCLISIGRTMASPGDVELMAEVLTGNPVNRDGIEFPGNWYPREVAGIRVNGAGDVGHPTITEVHPDQTAEAVRWSICEAGLIQAIGRARAVNRAEVDPVQIDIISTIPLPFCVDEVLAKDAIEPNPLAVMAARGLVIDEKASKGKWQIVLEMLPERFASSELAKKALKGKNANINILLAKFPLSDFISASIKLKDARYAVPVLIDGSKGDPREVAERLLGPLDAFKVLSGKSPKQPNTNSIEQGVTVEADSSIVYIEPPLHEAQPVPPPVEPKPLSLATISPLIIELPELTAIEVNPQSPSYSFDSIVEWVTGGGIPEPENYDEAVRIWMSSKVEILGQIVVLET